MVCGSITSGSVPPFDSGSIGVEVPLLLADESRVEASLEYLDEFRVESGLTRIDSPLKSVPSIDLGVAIPLRLLCGLRDEERLGRAGWDADAVSLSDP